MVQIDENMRQEVDVLGPGAKKRQKKTKNNPKPGKQIEKNISNNFKKSSNC